MADTGLHWDGVYTVDGSGVDSPVQAQYAYLTGKARWTAGVPIQHREWTFGDQGDDIIVGAPYTTKLRRGRGAEIPMGECTVTGLAVALQHALNGPGIGGALPFAGSGDASGCDGSGHGAEQSPPGHRQHG